MVQKEKMPEGAMFSSNGSELTSIKREMAAIKAKLAAVKTQIDSPESFMRGKRLGILTVWWLVLAISFFRLFAAKSRHAKRRLFAWHLFAATRRNGTNQSPYDREL